MDKQITNSVRNVLVNELGLTREFVRDEAQKYIGEVIEKRINSLLSEGKFKDLICDATVREVSKIKNGPHWGNSTLEQWVREQVRHTIERWFQTNINISVTRSP